MDERLRFVARLLQGENMSRVCREFGVSRPTGYKIFNQYKDLDYQGLLDRSRRPYRHANKLPFQLESAIIRLRTEHPSWGAAKIREKLLRAFPMMPAPAKSTVHAVLDRNGLVERRKRRRHKAQGTSLTDPASTNQLWCADFKGEFMLGNRQYCYPLTITDYSSRYLLACERSVRKIGQTASGEASPVAASAARSARCWRAILRCRLDRRSIRVYAVIWHEAINGRGGGSLIMWTKAALLSAVLVLAVALPAFADTPSNSGKPVTNPKAKPRAGIETNSWSVGANNPSPGSKGGSSKPGKASPGSIDLQKSCNQPNPPRSCKQAKPPH
jgi:transposase